MVNTKYKYILKKIDQIDKQCAKLLHQFLLDEARDRSFDKSGDLFNQLRGIMERIMECCKNNNIIPPDINQLNEFKRFFTYSSRFNKTSGKYELVWKGFNNHVPNDDLMPKPIGYTIEKLIDVIQDGSHKLKGLSVGVSDYVQDTQTPFVFRSCLYQILDIIRWYGELNEKLYKGTYKYPTYKYSATP